jgi:CubicO group peptidase (beta-lactamase class C family)
MSQYDAKVYKPVIEAMLSAQKAHSCAFWAEIVSEPNSEESALRDYATADGVDIESTTIGVDSLFALGSGMKLFINFALYRMMEEWETVLDDTEVQEMMRHAWNEPAFALYNTLRDHRGLSQWVEPRSCTPSVNQLITHSYGFPAHQRGLFGPDGSFLMSEETFGQTFAALVDSHSQAQGGDYNYSNWNTILLGFIIRHATGQPLAEALKSIVLDHCQMNNTVLDPNTFEQKRDKIAHPHVNTLESTCLESLPLNFLDNDAALAVGGGFSCVRDVAQLLKYLLKRAIDRDKIITEKFFQSKDIIKGEKLGRCSFPSGIYASLDSEATGSQSFERFPRSKIYKLGRKDGDSVMAISKAGAVRGYSCHFYMIPLLHLIVAVMTNTSGIADPSHIISQYIIQQIAQLYPQLDNIEQKASKIYTRNQQFLKREAACYRPLRDFSSEEQRDLQGRFIEATTRQCIVIQVSEGGQLFAYIEEGCGEQPRQTSRMRLIKIAKNMLAFSPSPQHLAVDAYHAWRNVGLRIRKYGGEIRELVIIDEPAVTGGSNSRVAAFNEVYKRKNEHRTL